MRDGTYRFELKEPTPQEIAGEVGEAVGRVVGRHLGQAVEAGEKPNLEAVLARAERRAVQTFRALAPGHEKIIRELARANAEQAAADLVLQELERALSEQGDSD